jgi:hypothetical protein
MMHAQAKLKAIRAVGFVAFGALVALPASAQTADAPTFTKDIAPIFQEKCEACHRPNSIAPMSLRTYEESRPWARSIKSRVAARQMPPWHLDKTVGIQEYKNDRSLNDEQIDKIVRWVDAGSPRGNPADMPAAKQWPDEQGWNFAKLFGQTEPDLIVKSTPYTQKAGAPDAWWKPIVDTGLTEARWVRAIEIRPGTVKGRKITHHALAYLQQTEANNPAGGAGAGGPFGGAGLFMEWAVGKEGEMMRPDTGKLMLPGAQIRWDIHYSNGGEDITDVAELGIYFYPKDQQPKFRTALGLYGVERETSSGTDIPPNTITVAQGFHVLRENARLESFQPHMHLRGKAMSLEAIFPDGRTQMISHVGDFNFNWHNSYVYADHVAPLLPKGTIMKVVSWWDNTAANPANPDPNQWVGYGDRTVDEMAHAWINLTFMPDADFQQEVQKRKESQSRTTQQQQQQ